MKTPTALTVLSLALTTSLSAQVLPRDGIEAELRAMFDRPAGTPITDEQKDALGAFIERHDGHLGDFGYVEALHCYLNRDYDGAFTAADVFFASHDAVPIEEHATMLGRIGLMGMMRGADADVRARHAARAARMYPDVAMLERALPRALTGLDADGQRTVRLALVRGALAGDRPDADRDALIRAVYGGLAQGATVQASASTRDVIPATPMRVIPSKPGAAEARERATAQRAKLTGAAAPALSALEVIGADELSLEGLRGKVVVLDFTATWCGPCRKVIPSMIELQKQHADALQVVAVTRYYGYGSDFRGEADGARAQNLDQAAELELNEAFAEHFRLNYPVVIVPQETMGTSYGVTGIPTVFVIGKDGMVAGHAVGAGEQTHEQVEALIKAALAR